MGTENIRLELVKALLALEAGQQLVFPRPSDAEQFERERVERMRRRVDELEEIVTAGAVQLGREHSLRR